MFLQLSLLQFKIPGFNIVEFAYAALDFMESIDAILEDNDLDDVSIIILKADEAEDTVT